MQEQWKQVTNFPDYWVSSEGRIWSEKSHKFLSQCRTGKLRNYLMVKLCNNEIKNKTYRVHRLVLETFSPIDDMENMTVNHINEDTLDNRLENLEWLTRKENIQYSSGQWIQQETMDREVVEQFPSIRAASDKIGCNVKSIYEHCISGKPFRNFYWKKIDNPRKI